MQSSLPVEPRKPFFRNDFALVCGMLVFCGICIIGLFGATIWWLVNKDQGISATTTVTTEVDATQKAQFTATSAAHATELATYSVVDTFDSNSNDWSTGSSLGLNGDETQQIVSGVYEWEIDAVHENSLATVTDFVPMNDWSKDYDTYVDTKFIEVSDSVPCSGLVVRRAPLGWHMGGYAFVICYSGHFGIYYHNKLDGWQRITTQLHSSIQPANWNRLEVLVKGSHFVFLINNQIVYETDDERQPIGSVALLVIAEKPGTKIFFDNFGYQPR